MYTGIQSRNEHGVNPCAAALRRSAGIGQSADGKIISIIYGGAYFFDSLCAAFAALFLCINPENKRFFHF